MNWFLYIIQTEKDRLYTGITTDIERRFKEHKAGHPKGAKFFRSDSPVKVVYTEGLEDRSIASKREYEIKSMTRAQKLKLCKLG